MKNQTYKLLREILKELQAIRHSLEQKTVKITSEGKIEDLFNFQDNLK